MFLHIWPLNDDTKILTKTDTDTFFPIPNFPKPKPKLCFRDQIFRNRNRYFFSETKFSETKTETFFRDHILRNRYRNPPKIGKSLKTETETFQYPCKFLELSSPNIFLLFLLQSVFILLSSRKKDILLPRIFSSFFFSVFLLLQRQRQRQRQRSSLCFPPSNR